MANRKANATEAEIRRAVKAVAAAGLPVVRVEVRPSGAVIVHTAEGAVGGADGGTWSDVA